jgi:DNA-binding CsgD family transcriptional regulator
MASALNNAGRTAEAVARLKVMLAMVPAAADVALRNRLGIRLAAFYAVLDAADESNRCIEEIDEATLAPDGPVSAEYFFVKSWISAQRFECELWHENFTRCLDTLDRSGASDHFKRAAHESVARQALDLGEIVMARKHALLSLDVARRTKIEEAYYLVLLAEVELRAGNLETARALFRDVGPSAEPLTRQGRAIVGTLLALALGDDDLLTQCVDLSKVEEAELSSNPSATVRLASACARGLLQLGRADEAASLLERAVGAIRSPFGIAPEIASMAMLRPEWAVRLRLVVAPGGGIPKHRVNAALCRLIDAILTRHSGDKAAARSPASEAARLFGAVGWPLLEAPCWEIAGEQPRALTIYRRTGSLADVRRLERNTFVGRAAATGCAVLTRRERELALLIAAGKDNRSAAEALSISKKAVEKYLTSIYAKLGLSSRAQLAAFVVGGESTERPTVKR